MSERRPLKDALMNGPGTVITRLMIIIGFPAMFALSAWIGNRLVAQLDSLAVKVEAQHDDTVKSLNTFDVRLTGAERDIKYLSERR